jgi:hypothetical protein
MSVNLVTLIMQNLTPDAVGRIASALGLGRENAQAGVAAGVPAILAGLANLASRPEGADRLAPALQQPTPYAVEQPSTARGGQEAGLAE